MQAKNKSFYSLKGGYPTIFASNVFHNSHLIQKCIQNSSCCWFCIHYWIKWELWKTFDTKMIGWIHFSFFEDLYIEKSQRFFQSSFHFKFTSHEKFMWYIFISPWDHRFRRQFFWGIVFKWLNFFMNRFYMILSWTFACCFILEWLDTRMSWFDVTF